MVRDLITLPLRLGLRVAGLAIRVSRQAVMRALGATEGPAPDEVVAGGPQAANGLRVDVVIARPSSTRAAPSRPATDAADRAPEPGPAPATPRATAVRPEPDTPQATAVLPELAPGHVSEKPVLVESFAERGAEESVGASVHVDEPWEGYAHMSAKEVIARLTDASREELAAVTLYETAHRARRTVLAAADRQLRRATAAATSTPRHPSPANR